MNNLNELLRRAGIKADCLNAMRTITVELLAQGDTLDNIINTWRRLKPQWFVK